MTKQPNAFQTAFQTASPFAILINQQHNEGKCFLVIYYLSETPGHRPLIQAEMADT